MSLRQTEVAVIGAGPAGIAAALAAAGAGARVTVVDEYPTAGGQIYRQLPTAFRVKPGAARGRDQTRAQALLSRLRSSSVEVCTGTLVWGFHDHHTLALYREGEGTEALRAQVVVVATGAYDRPVAFPGWTLPGVWTAGGAQTMVKAQQVLPGRRVLLAGAGPFLLPVARSLVEAGAQVVALAEATATSEWAARALAMLHHWGRVVEFIEYERALLRARVPHYYGHVIVRAEGDGDVRRATIAAVDRSWRPRAGTEKTFDVDLVCTGYGFLTSMEIPRLLGCSMRFDSLQGQFLPEHDEEMETSVPGVFVAGETAGVGGAELALAQGEIAGYAAARRLGKELDPRSRSALSAARARRQHLQGFADLLNRMFTMRPGIYGLAHADTPLCRCEEVTVGEVRQAIAHGARSMNALKSWLRIGMGPCQGRVCGYLAAHLLAAEVGVPPTESRPMTPRPPIKPIPLGAMAGLLEALHDEGDTNRSREAT
ncbi:MAG: FAD-dependent oxidoreductase [Chloroflexi bacterium]|nr:FAD-dependent oxidoreductase [Chloroflexota bacterium]